MEYVHRAVTGYRMVDSDYSERTGQILAITRTSVITFKRNGNITWKKIPSVQYQYDLSDTRHQGPSTKRWNLLFVPFVIGRSQEIICGDGNN
jgi:hypothetical protein